MNIDWRSNTINKNLSSFFLLFLTISIRMRACVRWFACACVDVCVLVYVDLNRRSRIRTHLSNVSQRVLICSTYPKTNFRCLNFLPQNLKNTRNIWNTRITPTRLGPHVSHRKCWSLGNINMRIVIKYIELYIVCK